MNHFSKCIHRMLISFLILLFLPILPAGSSADGETVLTLPKSLTTIATETFRGDTSLQKVVLQEGITSIQSRAFADSSIREIHLPASLTEIAENAFENTCLETVTAPKGSYAYQWAREHRYITEYRALLIGETKFVRRNENGEDEIKEVLRNANDVRKMAAMLSRVYGPTGEAFEVTQRTNLRRKALKAAIQTTFAGMMDHDVSLFFIATHGKSDGDGDLEMPYNGDLDDDEYWDSYAPDARHFLPFSTLAEWLSTMVNGKVIVILESCGAGSSIYEGNGEKKRGEKTEEELNEEFVQAAVSAFAKADPGVTTAAQTESFRKSTGDFLQPKFFVLAAAAHHEDSYGYSNNASDPVNLFTKWLIEGVGVKGNSPADTDQDDLLILNELHRYIQKVGDNYKIKINGVTHYQHVQAYPVNSNQAIFLLK